MVTVQYGEHGAGSLGAATYISHVRVADQAGGGYWIYLRMKTNTTGTGITYKFRDSAIGGIGLNINDIQSSTDPGSGTALYYGFNLISTGSQARFYRNANEVLDAGNVSTYALPINGGTLSGNLTINGNITSGAGYQVRWSDGSVAAPGYSFYADTDTGIHRSADNTLAIVTAGVTRATVGPTGTLNVVGALTLGGNPVLSEAVVTFTPTTVGWYRIATAGGNSSGTIRIAGFYDNRSAVLEFDYTVNGWNQGCSINLRNNNAYAGSIITQIRASNDVSTANGYLDIYIATATAPAALTIYNFGPARAGLVASPVVGAVVGANVVKIANINNVMGYVTTGPINADTMAIVGNGTVGGTLAVTGVTTFGSAATFSAASGTYINTGGGADAFGYNATAGRGHYIKGTGNTYIYGGGSFWDGSAAHWLLHAGNYSGYALPLTGGTLTGALTATSFSGAGTGLTGTAASLSIGGNAATTSQRAFSGDISSGGQGRFTGWYSGGASSGLAAEIGMSAGEGYVMVYDRSSATWGALNLQSSGARLQITGSVINAVTGSLQQGGNQVLHAGNYASVIGYTPAYGTAAYQSKSLDTVSTPGLYQYDGLFGGTKPPDNKPNYRTIEIGSGGRWTQIALPYDNDGFFFRRQTDASYSAWRTVIHDGNYTSYPPARWATGRTISLTGDVTGTSGAFDGTANLSFAATIANSSVTYAKIQNVAVSTVLGNSSASVAQAPQALSMATLAGMLSGQTMNINGSSASCTGNAATATNGFTVKPGWAGNQNLIAAISNLNNSVPSGFYEGFQATNSPTTGTWYNLINVRHSNTGNDHGFQLAMSYYDETLWSRSYQGGTGANNGTFTTWRAHLHSGNFSSYALPLTGGTMTGAITINGVSNAVVVQTNGNAAQWYGRVLCKNSTSDKSSFLGTYGSIAGVFAHNNALSAWADLYINTVDGSTGGTVRMPSSVLINGNQALHAGNYTSYSPSLTGGGASGTWGINISGSSASCSGNAATCTTANGIADGTVSTTAKLANSVVTYAKIQNVGASSVLGNTSASVSQAPQEITFANLGPYINGVARAWVTFNENPSTGAITINASLGISSVTRLAAGVYQVNFSTAFSDTHYAVSGTIGYESISAYTNGGYLALTRTATPKATTSCEVCALYGGTNYNARYVHVVFHR
jgi:hypothetical protein